jgi:hypothetical protein
VRLVPPKSGGKQRLVAVWRNREQIQINGSCPEYLKAILNILAANLASVKFRRVPFFV